VLKAAALAAKWKEPPRDALDTLVLTSAKLDELDPYEQIDFMPFDPTIKRTEGTLRGPDGKVFKTTKGAPHIILKLVEARGEGRGGGAGCVRVGRLKGGGALGDGGRGAGGRRVCAAAFCCPHMQLYACTHTHAHMHAHHTEHTPPPPHLTPPRPIPFAPQQVDQEEVAKRVNWKVMDLGRRGIRSLAVAKTNEEGKWIMLGILTFLDPPRPDTKETIENAMALGCDVKMITGGGPFGGRVLVVLCRAPACLRCAARVRVRLCGAWNRRGGSQPGRRPPPLWRRGPRPAVPADDKPPPLPPAPPKRRPPGHRQGDGPPAGPGHQHPGRRQPADHGRRRQDPQGPRQEVRQDDPGGRRLCPGARLCVYVCGWVGGWVGGCVGVVWARSTAR
jgi:hypothetical protein